MSEDGFLMFLARWTVLQRQDLPRLHVRIARWLERRTASRDEMLLLGVAPVWWTVQVLSGLVGLALARSYAIGD